MTLAERTSLVREMLQNGFTGDRARAHEIAKVFVKNGIKQVTDLEGMRTQYIEHELELAKQEQRWFELWFEKIADKQAKKRKLAHMPTKKHEEEVGSVDHIINLLTHLAKHEICRTTAPPLKAILDAADGCHSVQDKLQWTELAKLEEELAPVVVEEEQLEAPVVLIP